MRRNIVEKTLSPLPIKGGEPLTPSKQHFNEEPAPSYPIPYLYNASNNKAKEFYKAQGVEACSLEGFEHSGSLPTREGGGRGRGVLLMQCRYCLRNEMGYCTKSGKRAPWKEPLTISISDGREFQLQFDCKNCQMNVVSINK
jgi:putative protease